jgi:hypothetical protein
MFLICKPASKRLRVIKPPMHVTKIIYHAFSDANGFYLAYMKEFDVPSMFLLFFTSIMEETRGWLEMIQMAQAEFRWLADNDFERTYMDVERQRASSYRTDSHRSVGLLQHHQSYSSACFGAATAPKHSASVSHRKSHSMDSQLMAVSRPGYVQLRKSDALASAEQVDRGELEMAANMACGTMPHSIEELLEDREPSDERATLTATIVDDDSLPSRLTDRPESNDKMPDLPRRYMLAVPAPPEACAE